MTNLLHEVLKKKVNQLEESYHFNLEEYSFIYKDRKAFIVNLKENAKLIHPFLTYRKLLNDHIEGWSLEELAQRQQAEKFNNYLHQCMSIIGNMLDKRKMGSVEHYLDHIWKDYDVAIKGDTIELVQNFINDIGNIITMIDYSAEIQLGNMSPENVQSLVAQSIVESLDPNLEVVDVLAINEKGSIKRIKTKSKTVKEDEWDLANIRPLNTKEI